MSLGSMHKWETWLLHTQCEATLLEYCEQEYKFRASKSTLKNFFLVVIEIYLIVLQDSLLD